MRRTGDTLTVWQRLPVVLGAVMFAMSIVGSIYAQAMSAQQFRLETGSRITTLEKEEKGQEVQIKTLETAMSDFKAFAAENNSEHRHLKETTDAIAEKLGVYK